MMERSRSGVQHLPQKLKLAGSRDIVSDPVDEVSERNPSSHIGPDPVKDPMRFCDWAFSLLGHVNVFRFSEGGFMLVAENGERTRGDTLAVALLAMLERQGAHNRHLLYPETKEDSRAA